MRLFTIRANIIILCFFASFLGQAQTYPQDYFRSPLNIKHYYAGTFGELRPNHFHSGIDLSTMGKEGYPVYSVADGYVSRVKVSANGFGYALYITHPNGYTSVYGHIQGYYGPIAEYVKKKQYELESFELDIMVDSMLLPVHKSDTVAISGNAGASEGPHLHYELRDTKTQETINPLLFGVQISDTIAPVISGLKVYPGDDYSFVEHTNAVSEFGLKKSEFGYAIKQKDTLDAYGKVYFGLSTYDKSNNTHNQNGIYKVQIFIDDTLCYLHRLDKFNFKDTRFINDHIDYDAFMRTGRRYQVSKIAPGNTLCIYQFTKNSGYADFTDNKCHEVLVLSSDYSGNTSKLCFVVRSGASSLDKIADIVQSPNVVDTFFFDRVNEFERNDVKITVPLNVLHDNLAFEYYSTSRSAGCYSKVHHLHNIYVPINDFIDLRIKADLVPAKYREKVFVAKVSSKGGLTYIGGKYDEDGYMSAKIKVFANYAIAIDTIAPIITPVNIPKTKKLGKNQKTIQIKITDNLSGVTSYRATINGKWVLMSMEGKKSLLTYIIDDSLILGVNSFELTVTDLKGNKKVYKTNIIR